MLLLGALLLLERVGGVFALLVEQQVVVLAELILRHQAVNFHVGHLEAGGCGFCRGGVVGLFGLLVVTGGQCQCGSEGECEELFH